MTRLPGAVWLGNGTSYGPYTSGPHKIVIHTTETAWLPDYDGGSLTPHVTYDVAERKFYQHQEFENSVGALRNLSGGVQTNKDSALQFEIICYSDKAIADKHKRLWVGDLPESAYVDVAEACRFLMEKFGVENRLRLPRPKPIYGVDSPSRMSANEWDSFNGLCGHFEVPENTHWDPGAFDFVRLSNIIKEEDMTHAEVVAAVKEAMEIRERADHNGIVYRHSAVVTPSVWNIAFGRANPRYPSEFLVGAESYAKLAYAAASEDNFEFSDADVEAIAAAISADVGEATAKAIADAILAGLE